MRRRRFVPGPSQLDLSWAFYHPCRFSIESVGGGSVVQRANTGNGSAQPVGDGDHVVQQGECVISLADAHGHFWETIWNHPDNASVKEARGSPHVLLSGDRIHIPEITPKHEDCATDARHTFRRKGIPIAFEIVVKENGKVLSGKQYLLRIEDRTWSGTIDGSGLVTAPMLPQDRTGELKVFDDDGRCRVYPLEFGTLDPAHTPGGAAGRLRNLGLLGSDDSPEELESSLKKFQKQEGLEATGTLTAETANRLADVHGS
jgi:N-acetylmuramoyl-L-alanine amidase